MLAEQAIFLVFDATNFDSFQNVEDWYRLAAQSFDEAQLPTIVLVANKCTHTFCSRSFARQIGNLALSCLLACFFLSCVLPQTIYPTCVWCRWILCLNSRMRMASACFACLPRTETRWTLAFGQWSQFSAVLGLTANLKPRYASCCYGAFGLNRANV